MIPSTTLKGKKKKWSFEGMRTKKYLAEMKSLIGALNVESEILSHRSNYLMFSGMLPKDKMRD